ncbi:ABC transporter permease [Desulfococcus sp.]|jgi:ABC-2 type transport system permease protein|uniref:ABC transporter permease n=1 Tax=Desulfococcus sp. TaxID=2025834 RepID=UPI003D0FD666
MRPSPDRRTFERPRRRIVGMRRLRGMIRKEFLQILRDPSSIAIAFLLPVLLLLIHGYGVSLDATNVPIAFVAESPSAEAVSLGEAFAGSPYFNVRKFRTMQDAVTALTTHQVNGIVRVRDNFSGILDPSRQAPIPIQVILNGVDANTARLVSGYADGVWALWLQDRVRQAGGEIRPPVELVSRIWYNSEMRSRNFLVPGLIAVNMTLIGALLTAMVMAREWERGTLEALMVTPVSILEILLGKLIPYFIMGMGGMALSVIMAVGVFAVPLRGSLGVLVLTSSVFLLVSLGIGLFISIVARNQFVAGQIAIIVTFLPAFLLSGYIFDIAGMPRAVQIVTHAVAARYFIAILQSSFLAGDIPAVIGPNLAALVLMAVFFLTLCGLKSKKRLD